MSNLTEPQSLLREIGQRTSGELSSVEVIAYVEALSRSTSALAAGERDYAVRPSAINSTLTVISVYHSRLSSGALPLAALYALTWFRVKKRERGKCGRARAVWLLLIRKLSSETVFYQAERYLPSVTVSTERTRITSCPGLFFFLGNMKRGKTCVNTVS